MNAQRLDAADKETTSAFHRGLTFGTSLAWTDLEVYEHDHVKINVATLATRWRWSRENVSEVCRAFVKRNGGKWRPVDLKG